MPLNIPLPDANFGGVLAGIPSEIEQNRLRRAQVQQALGNAAQSQMLAKLMGTAFGGNIPSSLSSQGYQLTPTDQQAINKLQPGQSYTIPSPQNQISQNDAQKRAKNMLQALGIIKPTLEEQQAADIETEYQKELGKTQAKKIGELENVAEAGIEAMPTYEAAAAITSHPDWAKMKSNPIVPGAQIEYYKRFGTPEQRRMIGEFASNTNQFILNSVKKFPQRFTNKDMTFMLSMKPNERDTLEAGQAKLESAYAYDKILSDRAALTAKIAREQRIPTNEAMQIANKQMYFEKIRNDIREKVRGANYSHKTYKNKKTGETISYEEARKRGIIE